MSTIKLKILFAAAFGLLLIHSAVTWNLGKRVETLEAQQQRCSHE
jgi:hypothetical protein